MKNKNRSQKTSSLWNNGLGKAGLSRMIVVVSFFGSASAGAQTYPINRPDFSQTFTPVTAPAQQQNIPQVNTNYTNLDLTGSGTASNYQYSRNNGQSSGGSSGNSGTTSGGTGGSSGGGTGGGGSNQQPLTREQKIQSVVNNTAGAAPATQAQRNPLWSE